MDKEQYVQINPITFFYNQEIITGMDFINIFYERPKVFITFSVQRSHYNTGFTNIFLLPGNPVRNPVQETWRRDLLLQE